METPVGAGVGIIEEESGDVEPKEMNVFFSAGLALAPGGKNFVMKDVEFS